MCDLNTTVEATPLQLGHDDPLSIKTQEGMGERWTATRSIDIISMPEGIHALRGVYDRVDSWDCTFPCASVKYV